MSVLIKGMDMPNSCADCQAYINNGNSCWCVLINKDIRDKEKRDENCPLVSVPTPHGRLIDGDKAEERLFSYYSIVNRTTSKSTYRGDTLMDYEVADMIEDCVSDAPTVIESEE